MFNTSLLAKKVAVGVAAVGLATTASVLTTADSAEAVSLRFRLTNVEATDGGVLSGWFDYNSTNNTFSGFNISSTAGSSITSARTYSGTMSFIDYASNALLIQTNPSPLNPGDPSSNSLRMAFNQDITLLSLGDTATILQGSRIGPNYSGSYEFFEPNNVNFQARTLSGGTVVVTEVPEPLTILGTLLAGGIGVALKKKRGASSSESC